MKTVIGVASNVLANPDGTGVYPPLCEVVLTLEEKEYVSDDGEGDGKERVKSRYVNSTVRFVASPDNLRELADNLCQIADRSERELVEFIEACRATKPEGCEGVNLDTPADAGRAGVQYCTGGDAE